MKHDPFFDQVPRLRMQDPLARLLGGVEDGILEYGYADVVRLAGHSCPTVAATYWMTWLAMESLYPGESPQRGGLRIELREDSRTGSNGVAATILQMLTGAAGRIGFRGLHGRFNRLGLIQHAPDLLSNIKFTRLDTGEAVETSADLALLPMTAGLETLLRRCIHAQASRDEETLLARLWQERVRRLLLEHARDPGIFSVRRVERRHLSLPAKAAVRERRDEALSSTSA